MLNIISVIVGLILVLEIGFWSMFIEQIKVDIFSRRLQNLRILSIVLSIIGTLLSGILMFSDFDNSVFFVSLFLTFIFISQMVFVFLSIVVLKTKRFDKK